MKKGYKETLLQLILSPLHIFVSDSYQVGWMSFWSSLYNMHSVFKSCLQFWLFYSSSVLLLMECYVMDI